MDGPEYPSCDPAGLFQPKQCLGFTGDCWCVVPETGTRIPGNYHFTPDGLELDCSSKSGISCFMSSCSSFYFGNGFALTADILVWFSWLVSLFRILKQQSTVRHFILTCFSDLTRCQTQYLNTARRIARNPSLVNADPLPGCAADGLYVPKQCDSAVDVCWCCCNLSGGVALIVWFTRNGMCVKNNTIHICGANKQ